MAGPAAYAAAKGAHGDIIFRSTDDGEHHPAHFLVLDLIFGSRSTPKVLGRFTMRLSGYCWLWQWCCFCCITASAAALLRNLFSLTGRQRHNSLKRLSQLGAKPSAIVFINGLEIVILYVTVTPLGMGLGLLLGTALTGMRVAAPPLPLLLGTALGGTCNHCALRGHSGAQQK